MSDEVTFSISTTFPEPSPIEDKPLTLDDCLDALKLLRSAHVPAFEGSYHVYLSPLARRDFDRMMLSMTLRASYRVELHACAFYERARARYFDKKGPLPEATTAYLSAIKLEPYRGEYVQRALDAGELVLAGLIERLR